MKLFNSGVIEIALDAIDDYPFESAWLNHGTLRIELDGTAYVGMRVIAREQRSDRVRYTLESSWPSWKL